MKKILLAALFIIATASFAVADTIYLRDGRTIRGTLLGFVNGQFVVRVEAGNFPTATTDPNVARRRRDAADIQYFRPDEIDRIEINDLENHTFFARIHIRHNGSVHEIDSRPSDAIALGIATSVPIYVAEHVLDEVC